MTDAAFLRHYAAATIYEANGRYGLVGPTVFSLVPGTRLAGPAATVRCWPGDTLGIWEAVVAAPAGAVLVADVGDTSSVTALGGGTVRAAIARGLAGILTNGAVRDIADIRSLGLPVFARGIGLRGTTKTQGGAHGIVVAIGEAVIKPGDWVYGDDDGAGVVETTRLAGLAGRLEAQAKREAEIDARLSSGEDPRRVLGVPEPKPGFANE